jgi:predicted GNAT family N-acyltransferase
MTREELTEIIREVLAEETQEQTVNFDLKDINGVKVVLATYDGNRVGALRLKPYRDSYQVDSVIVQKDYRGYGIGKELYRLAHNKLGPLYSDAHQTSDASSLWQSLVKSGEAKQEGDRFVMTEGPHDAMNPGILSKDSSLKGKDGKIKISKVRQKLSSMKDKGSTKAKALRRFINYHD